MARGLIDRALRMGEARQFKEYEKRVDSINRVEPEMELLDDAEIREEADRLRERAREGESLDDLLPEAFALTREAARRRIGQRHFDVQLIGGMVLHDGAIAEMKTGEGKTLTATLAVFLNSLAGEGVHLVTVNDYLARRDAEWMGPIYDALGVTVAAIQESDDHETRKRKYAADVTYGTNSEFGFDYLRDNMAAALEHCVQRGHKFAIVDEVDNILIDEARTPLIISGAPEQAADTYYTFARLAKQLTGVPVKEKLKSLGESKDTSEVDYDYEYDEKHKTVAPTEKGVNQAERFLGVDNLYVSEHGTLVNHLIQSLKAESLYKRDREYAVIDGQVMIVDEFTGRILEGRRWSEGLHQAVEAKEGVRIKEENQTLATVTLQNYFRMYEKLAGMTGTAQSDAAELAATYELQVVPIPTNMPLIRKDEGDLIYKSEEVKFEAVAEDIAERYEQGQPVLVGTISVEKSERLSRLLDKQGISHEVLNAKPDRAFREAEIVAQAGRLPAVTLATNMAGRGVDIILGGNPEGLAKRDLRAEGLDPDAEENRARLEELTARHEAETKPEGDKVRELGGLYVLGTERHDSRRIDNQLRGRSGRQGDPGESRFYLSLEDDLMRLFATGAVNWVMNKTLPDDVPLEAKMVTKAIERAQTTVEQRNAEIRKNVLKYDEVMNEQRKVIYALRDQVLDQSDLRDKLVEEALPDAVNTLVETHCVSEYAEEWDLEGLQAAVRTFWPSTLSVEQMQQAASTNELYEMLMDEALAHFERREAELTPEIMRQVERQVMLRVIDQRWRAHLHEMDYLREGINLRAMGQKDPLVEWQRDGFDMFGQMMHGIWQDFIRYVMHVQVQVNRPPAPAAAPAGAPGAASEPATVAAGSGDGDAEAGAEPAPPAGGGNGRRSAAAAPAQTNTPVVKSEWDKTPRNAPCPCGSGKKFKQCHGR